MSKLVDAMSRLLAAHPSLHVSAVEPAQAMREAFKRSQPLWELPEAVSVRDGSATCLPFGDATFDAVFVAQVCPL